LAEEENRFDDVWMRNSNVSNVSANKETIILLWVAEQVYVKAFIFQIMRGKGAATVAPFLL